MNQHARLRRVHLVSGVSLALFVGVHLILQFLALFDMPLHRHWTQMARIVYREPVVEAFLTLLIGNQILTGWRLAGTASRRSVLSRIQRLSGIYLACFFIIHLSAVHIARTRGVDSNFEFAVAGFRNMWGGMFLGPYYVLAVMAVFLHLGCALRSVFRRTSAS